MIGICSLSWLSPQWHKKSPSPHIRGQNYSQCLDILIKKLKRLSYKVKYGVIDASWYGTAQRRKRFILIATRHDIPMPILNPVPPPTYKNPPGWLSVVQDLKFELSEPTRYQELVVTVQWSSATDDSSDRQSYQISAIDLKSVPFRLRHISLTFCSRNKVDQCKKQSQIGKDIARRVKPIFLATFLTNKEINCFISTLNISRFKL